MKHTKKPPFRFSLEKKFMFSLSAVLFSVLLCSLYLNANVIGRYYLYLEKKELSRVSDEAAQIGSGNELPQTKGGNESPQDSGGISSSPFTELEEKNDVTLIRVPYTNDNNLLNERLRTAFTERGLGLRRFWLWDQDQEAMEQGERRTRLYRQEGLHYSLLVEYQNQSPDFYAAVKVIPETQHTVTLINRVTSVVFAGAGILLLFLISILVRRITRPLAAIGKTAHAIANLDFRTVETVSHDELGDLAVSINDMSQKLSDTHRELERKSRELERKNQELEELLLNVSHDLKTPISLIKAYASGMKDGLDDGTFPDTILLQTDRMEELTARLLTLSRLRHKAAVRRVPESINLALLLQELTGGYELEAAERNLNFLFNWEVSPAPCVPAAAGLNTAACVSSEFTLLADREDLETILTNLLTNAVTYAAPGAVELNLVREQERIRLCIRNQIAPETAARLDLDRLWDPFYVGESSRNRALSGTGLGLSIVRAAAARSNWDCTCRLEKNSVCFQVLFT